MIRPMLLHDERRVREILRICYPDLEEPAESWYFANPTFVAVDDEVMGFTSFTVVTLPIHGKVMYGQHVCIHPDYRGKGVARELHTARLDVARDLGCTLFIGVAQPSNKAMVRVLVKAGAHECVSVGDGSLYVGPIC